MAIHSSILAWRIPWIESLAGYSLWGHKESDMTEQQTLDCNPLGSSAHGISQGRILEWVVISFSRGSSRPRDQTPVSCIEGGFFTAKQPGKLIINSIAEYVTDVSTYIFPKTCIRTVMGVLLKKG